MTSHRFLAVADQGISSVTNLLLTVAIARLVDQGTFGQFVVLLLIFSVALGVFRAGVADVFLIEFGHSRAVSENAFCGVALWLGLFTAVPLVVAAGLSTGSLQASSMAFAVVIPAVLVQDSLRYIAIRRGTAGVALTMDCVWLVTLVAILSLTDFAASPELVISSWGFGSFVSLGLGLVVLAVRPALKALPVWWRTNRRRARSLLADFGLMTGTIYAAFLLVGLVSAEILAALRGAQILFAPFEVGVTGLRLITLPLISGARGTPGFLRRIRQVSLGLVGVAAIWSGFVAALPDTLGTEILGDTWAAAASIIPAFALGYLARASCFMAIDGIRASDRPSLVVGRRAMSGALILVGAVLGALLNGTAGAAAGFAVALILGVPIWWTGLLSIAHDQRPVGSPSSGAGPTSVDR